MLTVDLGSPGPPEVMAYATVAEFPGASEKWSTKANHDA